MKQFISKAKNLSQRAAEIKAAIQQLPPKVAEIREAVAATTGQLQQLKSEIHHSVLDLKAENENHLSEALQEISASGDVFPKAGFVLSGVDLEISPVQRMLVHLTKVAAVHSSVLRSLASANQHRRTVHAILSSLFQASQMAETVELGDLVYDEVIVGVGPIPSVRLCWRGEEVEATSATQPSIAMPAPGAAAHIAPPPAAPSAFSQSSYFEKPSSPPMPLSAPPSANIPQPIRLPLQTAASPTIESPSTVTELNQDPLARFKKMPDLSRSKR